MRSCWTIRHSGQSKYTAYTHNIDRLTGKQFARTGIGVTRLPERKKNFCDRKRLGLFVTRPSNCKKAARDAMYQVFINGYRLAEVSHGKPYYVYRVEILASDGRSRYFIEKRYSEFSALHRALKKQISDIAPFPPKRVRNSQPKVLEQRRAALEFYIQKMLRLSATKQQVLNFLGIESRTPGAAQKRVCRYAEDTKNAQHNTVAHHPVLTFHCDPYVHPNSTTSLPDIVTSGVLLGMYKS